MWNLREEPCLSDLPLLFLPLPSVDLGPDIRWLQHRSNCNSGFRSWPLSSWYPHEDRPLLLAWIVHLSLHLFLFKSHLCLAMQRCRWLRISSESGDTKHRICLSHSLLLLTNFKVALLFQPFLCTCLCSVESHRYPDKCRSWLKELFLANKVRRGRQKALMSELKTPWRLELQRAVPFSGFDRTVLLWDSLDLPQLEASLLSPLFLHHYRIPHFTFLNHPQSNVGVLAISRGSLCHLWILSDFRSRCVQLCLLLVKDQTSSAGCRAFIGRRIVSKMTIFRVIVRK
mmetsp:Transcript_5894/g.9357  ORF Transcript_5894/g.9357 Transcript_5894/m.9357 type:complete len:285 (+) Transcript_5894:1624-2478(+)